MTALQKYQQRVKVTDSLLCVGLDSDIAKIPERFQKEKNPQFSFNKWIIDQTHEHVSAFKPNIAFYEARGDQGIKELNMTMKYLEETHPDIFTIADAKRADIGSTNEGYVQSIFDWLKFDAVTLHPYLGSEALKPFLEREDKVSIILCRTSNPGAGEFQDLEVKTKVQNSKFKNNSENGSIPFWEYVAHTVSKEWNGKKNCMLVVGATYPKELATVRKIVGDMPLLIPGIGAQGGDVEETVKAGKDTNGKGIIISSSRAVIFSKDPAGEATKLQKEINEFRRP